MLLSLFKQIAKLFAVRKVLEIIVFLALGSFGTSWIAEIIHWIISPNVHTHLRKVSKIVLSLTKNTEEKSSVFSFAIISRVLQVLLALFCLILLFLSTNSYKLCRSQQL